jgi:hypothetical protein
MRKYYADLAAATRRMWKGDGRRRLAEEILLLAGFVVTSSWLVRP